MTLGHQPEVTSQGLELHPHLLAPLAEPSHDLVFLCGSVSEYIEKKVGLEASACVLCPQNPCGLSHWSFHTVAMPCLYLSVFLSAVTLGLV